MAPRKAVGSSHGGTGAPKSSHPPFAEMVVDAVSRLTLVKRVKGASLVAIKKYIEDAFQIDLQKQGVRIKNAVKSAVGSGIIIQVSGTGANGSFKMPPKMDLPAAKQPANLKKDRPAAKQPAKPKKVAVPRKPKEGAGKRGAKGKVIVKKEPATPQPPVTPRRAARMTASNDFSLYWNEAMDDKRNIQLIKQEGGM